MMKLLLLLIFYIFSVSSVKAINENIHLKCEGNYDYGNGYFDNSFQGEIIINTSTKTLILPIDEWLNPGVVREEEIWPAAYFELRVSDEKYRGFRDISNHDIFNSNYLYQVFAINRKDLSFSSLMELSESGKSMANINGYVFTVGQCQLYSKQENLI